MFLWNSIFYNTKVIKTSNGGNRGLGDGNGTAGTENYTNYTE
jgi:hypothetical protein